MPSSLEPPLLDYTDHSADIDWTEPAARVQMLYPRGVASSQPEVSSVQHVSTATFKQEPAHRRTQVQTPPCESLNLYKKNKTKHLRLSL